MRGNASMLHVSPRVARAAIPAAALAAGLLTFGFGATSTYGADFPMLGFADIAERAMPAYVDVTTTSHVAAANTPQQQAAPQGPFDQFFRDFFDKVPNAPQTGRTVTS